MSIITEVSLVSKLSMTIIVMAGLYLRRYGCWEAKGAPALEPQAL